MTDLSEQLAVLRQKVARINRKYAEHPPEKPLDAAPRLFPDDLRPVRYLVENLVSGEVVSTAFGEHFEAEKLYERHRRHGSVEISDLVELPEDLLESLSGGAISRAHPKSWAFLDTETTGLAGGTGTYAFLVGVGSIDDTGFRVRQFFMREFGEEASLLAALSSYLDRFDVLVTYNGKTYDQPLLETRYRMARSRPPFDRLQHLDLLFGARRLWKLRLESCRLVDLERQVLGVEREGDLPGELIPYCYFDYLRNHQAFRMVPIFHHNVMDIISLACLTAIVPFAFRDPVRAPVRHGADLIGVARWLIQAERHDEALGLLRRAVEIGLPDRLLFRTLWDIAITEKKLGREPASLAGFTALTESPNPFRTQAFEELAKYYERRERNYAMALEMTRSGLAWDDSPAMRRREQRLKDRVARLQAKSSRLPL